MPKNRRFHFPNPGPIEEAIDAEIDRVADQMADLAYADRIVSGYANRTDRDRYAGIGWDQ